jgi:hypothetical protein
MSEQSGLPSGKQGSPVTPGSIGSGVTLGSLLIYIAQRLPQDDPLRDPLIYFAPVVAAGMSSAWAYARFWWQRTNREAWEREEAYRRLQEARRQADEDAAVLTRARATILRRLEVPTIAGDERASLLARLEEIEQLQISEDAERATAVIKRRRREQ